MMRSVVASSAQYAIVPIQDVLGLGSEARMNTPGTCGDPNWIWRLLPSHLGFSTLQILKALLQPFGRTAGLDELADALKS